MTKALRKDTRFKKGNPGRRPGSRNKATVAVEALLDGEAEKLTRKAIEMALAGFTKDDLNVEVKDNLLTITGKKEKKTQFDLKDMWHKGISERNFTKRVQNIMKNHMGIYCMPYCIVLPIMALAKNA